MYICLEGIDGSGKSTQIILLEKWLEEYGCEVKRIFEPTDSSVGKLIREMLKDPGATGENFQKTLALLFAADRMILMDEIENAEESGKVVISDRSFYSSIVYQNEPKWLYEINRYVKKPDVVILLDLDVETALTRCDGKDSFESKLFLENIREKYLQLAEENDFFVINANNGVNKVHEDIKRVISPKIGRCI
jgi:dTMP kinase